MCKRSMFILIASLYSIMLWGQVEKKLIVKIDHAATDAFKYIMTSCDTVPHFAVRARIFNPNKDTVFYGTMSCDRSVNFSSTTPAISVCYFMCMRNTHDVKPIPPGGFTIVWLRVVAYVPLSPKRVRLAFRYQTFKRDETYFTLKPGEVTVLSNPLKFGPKNIRSPLAW